jgi:hypothetical protein
LHGEFSEKAIPLRPPVHFPEQNAKVFRLGVRLAALFNCSRNFPITVLKLWFDGVHVWVLLWKWGDEITPEVHAAVAGRQAWSKVFERSFLEGAL